VQRVQPHKPRKKAEISWAVWRGTNNTELARKITYLLFRRELGLSQEQVDEMDNDEVETYKIMIWASYHKPEDVR
jgi:hypothetical protein